MTEAGTADMLPGSVGTAMHRYLRDTKSDGPRVLDLLMPLAWSQGDGLADPATWAELATALGTARYAEQDVGQLLASRAAGLLQRSQAGTAHRYRLFHEALAEHLRAEAEVRMTASQAQARFADVLLNRVPTQADGARNWPAADEYTRTFLTTHAARGGLLDAILADAACLATVEPGRLLAALPAASTRAGRSRAAALGRVGQQLLSRPASEQAALIELAAHLGGDTDLAEAMAAVDVAKPWAVRWSRWTPTHVGQLVAQHDDDVCALHVVTHAGEQVVVSASAWTVAFHRLADGQAASPAWREQRNPIRTAWATADTDRITTVVLHQNGDLRTICTTGSRHSAVLLSSGH